MNRMNSVKKSVIAAACIALCIVLPMAFHSIPNGGNIYLPMHIPVLLCGLICGWPYGLLCGLAGPVLSSLLTGMPAVAVLPSMAVELAVYGTVTGLLIGMVKTKNRTLNVYISLISAQILGRIAAGTVKALIFVGGEYSIAMWVAGHFVTSAPGIVIQLILIPAVINALVKAKIIPVDLK